MDTKMNKKNILKRGQQVPYHIPHSVYGAMKVRKIKDFKGKIKEMRFNSDTKLKTLEIQLNFKLFLESEKLLKIFTFNYTLSNHFWHLIHIYAFLRMST